MSNFNTTIIEQFRANGGRGEFDGVPLILLHHVGAKSGTERVTPVVCYPQSDGRFAIIASNGGPPQAPTGTTTLNRTEQSTSSSATRCSLPRPGNSRVASERKCGPMHSARLPN
jgi:hypothetical protein